MAQPIVKYTLNKKGQIPEWIDTSDASFMGEHAISGNKTGYIPKYESPQEMIMLGIAKGDPDPDGTPDDYVGTISTKSALTTYLTATGSTLQYKTTTATVTGVQTSVTTGLSTAWNQESYSGGLSTTTSTKYTASGVGTVATISSSAVTKVVTVVDTTTGSSISTVSNPVTVDPASTLSGVSTSVGIVTTTGADGAGLAHLTLVAGRVVRATVGALKRGRALIDGLESVAVQVERVHLVVVDLELVAALLLALLHHLLCLAAELRIAFRANFGQF